MIRMNDGDFLKRVHEGVAEGEGIAGSPSVKWIKRVEKYWS